MVARLRQLQEDRRGRRRLRAALTREAAAQATVRQLREELAVLVPQLFAAEQAALLFWRYQVAIGDAAQHAFEQHLAAFTTRRSRGMCRPIRDWWCGANPAVSDVAGTGLPSIGTAQPDWADQVARVTMPAKRVLVRRGLLDITHGLRLPPLPGAPPAQRNGRPTGRDPDPATGDGARPPLELDVEDRDQPDEA
jgi:glutathione S-transferase